MFAQQDLFAIRKEQESLPNPHALLAISVLLLLKETGFKLYALLVLILILQELFLLLLAHAPPVQQDITVLKGLLFLFLALPELTTL